MKLKDMAMWVGISGTTLRRRAKNIGYQLDLKDEIDVTLANKLYRELPVERVMTITYKNPRKPSIDFTGPWNIHDWNRLFKKIQQAIMIRQRDFIRAVRKEEKKPKAKTMTELPLKLDLSATYMDAVAIDAATNLSNTATSLAGLVPVADVIISNKEQDDGSL